MRRKGKEPWGLNMREPYRPRHISRTAQRRMEKRLVRGLAGDYNEFLLALHKAHTSR